MDSLGQISSLSMSQDAINTRSADFQLLGNFCGPGAFFGKSPNLCGVDGRLPALIHPLSFSFGDAFHLPFTSEIGLKFREYAKHVQKAFSRRRARINRLVRGAEGGSFGFDYLDNFLEVCHGASQSVHLRDHQNIAGPQELQQGFQLGSAFAGGAAHLLLADNTAPRTDQLLDLGFQVLVCRAHSRVAINRHG
ncbi:protein of unknown function [Hyphomicrobium sp. MC1]|nr:protein of unknown function [Hyphomicrobium sp. MC1]